MHKYIFVYLEGCPQCKILDILLKRAEFNYSSINIIKFILNNFTIEERDLYKQKSLSTPMLLRIENNNTLKHIELQSFFTTITNKWKTINNPN